jgi:hypothetical protein
MNEQNSDDSTKQIRAPSRTPLSLRSITIHRGRGLAAEVLLVRRQLSWTHYKAIKIGRD